MGGTLLDLSFLCHSEPKFRICGSSRTLALQAYTTISLLFPGQSRYFAVILAAIGTFDSFLFPKREAQRRFFDYAGHLRRRVSAPNC